MYIATYTSCYTFAYQNRRYIEQKIQVLFKINILQAVHKNTYSLIALVLVVRFICKIRIMALLL